MKKRHINQDGLLIAILLCMGFILASVTEVSAASKTKTFYIPTVLTIKYSDSDGEKATIKETRKYTDQGLYVSSLISDKTSVYNSYSVTKRDKKGRVLKQKQYSDTGRLDGTYSYKYWKNGRIKKVVFKPTKGSKVRKQNINKKGYITKRYYKDGKNVDTYTYKYKFNKKGDLTSIVMKWNTKKGSKKTKTRMTIKTTVKNTYIKKGKNKGKLSKQVAVARGSLYNTSSTTETTTIKNTYNKKGRLVKTITTIKRKDSDGDSNREKTVTTYHYEKVKVPKKYWKACKYVKDGTFFKQMVIEE